MRYTGEYADRWFRELAQTLGKDVAEGNDRLKVGAWRLDFNSCYGGGVIEEIYNESGGVTRPLTDHRLSPWNFGVMCQVVINLHKRKDDYV